LHTQYSLLDGAVQPVRLFERAGEMGMGAVAITDHGNMHGAIDFYSRAKAAGVKPIIGIEAYISPTSRFDKQKGGIKESSYHLLLLAENLAGYQNLLKLASMGFTEGFYYRPRIDKEILAELNEGIICTSACISGEVPRLLVNGDRSGAEAAADSYAEIFGDDRFFIEIQQHEGEDHPDVMGELIDIADKKGLGVVATNDVHFLDSGDHKAHDALTCISTGKLVSDDDRMRYPRDVYFKSVEEMYEIFGGISGACENTVAIAERCNVEIPLEGRHAPRFETGSKGSPEEYLTELVYAGAKERYGKVGKEVKDRIDRELEVIEGKGFSSYFLIVWDFCNYARQNGIPVGARGSAVGTVVGYCLGICDVDPIHYDLLFERFMDPARNEMPDIDVDICQAGRPRVLEYVRSKYGHIAQIITFGTMKARAVIRDVCRVMNVSLAEADRLAKLVPTDLKMTLDKALEVEPELKKAYDEDDTTREVIEIGRKLEGLTRHCSVHACGVVIADEPLTNFLPVCTVRDSEDVVTQFEGPTVERVGLLKMDFLGLKTLSIIQRSLELIKEIHGVEIDIEKIDITDQKVFKDVFAAGKTGGVFQFESGGMQDLLMKLKPDRLEDLIAANALYRPGPMALIPDYIDRKHGAKWEVPHKIMREVLAETFGIMVYQEQVMRICNRLGDIPLREAYTLIKAIGKKKHKVIAKEKKRFIKGCVGKGLSDGQASEIFELIERFAGYGFNKSHATRYSFIAYQTAYLKAYYPLEFMAALLTYEMGDSDKVVDYIGQCKGMGIEVLGPDINESFSDFTVVYDHRHEKGTDSGRLRFGLAAVKGVGVKAVEKIIEAREEVGGFKDLFHFCETVDMHSVNKQVVESLIKAGAFDNLGGSRSQMYAAMDRAMQAGARVQADALSGQMALFGGDGDEDVRPGLPEVPPWPEMQMLSYEKEVLGFFITSNPLSQHAELISAYSSSNSKGLERLGQDAEVVIGGMITKVRQIITKNGRNAGAKMAVATIEDLQGGFEVVFWPRILEKYSEKLEVDRIVFVKGKVDCRREKPNVICDELIKLEESDDVLAGRLWIDMDSSAVTEESANRILEICSKHKGRSSVSISVGPVDGYRVSMSAPCRIRPGGEIRNKLEQVEAIEGVRFCKD
jgi:DNA polymerase-3 subunit alpha